MTVADRNSGGGGGYVERSGAGSSGLADVIELILDKGLVIDVFVRVSLVGIELLTIDARIVVASVDTYLRFAEATNRLDLYAREGRQGPARSWCRASPRAAPRARPRASSRGRSRRSAKHSAAREEREEAPRRRPASARREQEDGVSPTYVYGVVAADAVLPEGLRGLGPSGKGDRSCTDGRVARRRR